MNDSEAAGRIVINLFTTLDGVAQAPGGRNEDPSGGFRFGGWQAPFEDEVVGNDIMSGLTAARISARSPLRLRARAATAIRVIRAAQPLP